MAISRKVLMQYAEKPEFSAVIDLLIDAGLLAGSWTAEDLLRALQRYELRFEIVSLFGGVEPVNDRLEEAAYQARVARGPWRASRTNSQRSWRKNPRNVVREKKSDKRRHVKLTYERRMKRKKNHREFQSDQRNEAKAKREARIASLHKAERGRTATVGWQWEKSANQAIA